LTSPRLPSLEGPEEKASRASVRVYRKDGPGKEDVRWVVREKAVTLYVNGSEVVTLLCTGHHLEELAAGFCYAEGFLKSPEDLESIRVEEDGARVEVTASSDPSLARSLWQKRTVTSGCGKGSLFYFALDALLSRPVESSLRFDPRDVWDRMEELNRLSETYRRTRGVHNTALATPGKILLFRDDIGRHNAVDMIVGHALLNRLDLEDKMLLTTGRFTSEILIKAAKVGLPVLVSRNTATSLAIELAQSFHITLVGYARGGQFTVYSGNERIREESCR